MSILFKIKLNMSNDERRASGAAQKILLYSEWTERWKRASEKNEKKKMYRNRY